MEHNLKSAPPEPIPLTNWLQIFYVIPGSGVVRTSAYDQFIFLWKIKKEGLGRITRPMSGGE